jgi:tetratricopeptide (TPR) repeat protein
MNVKPSSIKGLLRFLAPSAGGSLADRALGEKGITRAQHEECIRLQEQTGRPLDEILVERGYLTAADVTGLRKPSLPREVEQAARDPKNALGHYILVSRAGMGGMAEVWKSWDCSLGRWVAVKFLKDKVAQPDQRIEREGRMAAQLSHPGIISIYERGMHEGRPYLVMPLVTGTSPRPPVSPKEAARLAHGVAQALMHIHKMGVIHRDVQPANILVETGGRVVLADFGLAISDASRASKWGMSGTPEYASPEQVEGTVLDPRTDIYSLGATLYYWLSGRPPFIGKSVEDTGNRILHSPLAPLKKVPRKLERVVLRAMRREPKERYPTVEAMDQDLRGFLDPIWGSLPSSPRALAAVLVAGMMPWAITGIVAWRRDVRNRRIELVEALRPVEQELAHAEQLFADAEVPLDVCRVSAVEAFRSYNQILREQESDSSELEAGMARCLELTGQDAEAERHYLAAGTSPQVGLGLARIALRRHFEGRVDEDWRKAAARILEERKATNSPGVARVLHAFASGRPAEALAAAGGLGEQGRHDDVLQMVLGASAVERSNWDEAINRFEQAIRLRRADAASLYWKGVALQGKGDRAQATACLEEAARMAPVEWPLLSPTQRRLEDLGR